MYTLREIKGGLQTNTLLGEAYTLVEKAKVKPEEWELHYKNFYRDVKPKSEPYAFIVSKGGLNVIAIYKNRDYYIVMPNGQTFTRIYNH